MPIPTHIHNRLQAALCSRPLRRLEERFEEHTQLYEQRLMRFKCWLFLQLETIEHEKHSNFEPRVVPFLFAFVFTTHHFTILMGDIIRWHYLDDWDTFLAWRESNGETICCHRRIKASGTIDYYEDELWTLFPNADRKFRLPHRCSHRPSVLPKR